MSIPVRSSAGPLMSRSHRGPRAPRAAAVVALLAGLAVVSGCEDRGVPEPIATAQAKLLSVSAGGLAAPPETRRRTYQSVVQDLQGVSGEYDGVVRETASSLLGEAQTGLAQIELGEAVGPAGDVSALAVSARLAASEFANQSAIAAAMRSGDSGADLDRVAEEARRVAQEIEQARIDREGLVAQVAQLNRRQQEQRTQATAIREQEAGVRQEALRASADERAQRTEEAYRLARRAAEFERAASDLQAQADVLLPEVRNAEIRERQLQTLAQQLETTRKNIEADRARRLEDAQAAQVVADGANARLTEVFSALREAINGPFDSSSNEAVNASTRAVGTLRSANNRLALGAAQQGLGDAHRLRATAFRQAISALEFLSSLQPAPRVASDAAALAAELAERADAATASAAQAYADAAASLRSGGGRAQGDTRERVEAAATALEQLAATLTGEADAAPEAPDDPALNEG